MENKKTTKQQENKFWPAPLKFTSVIGVEATLAFFWLLDKERLRMSYGKIGDTGGFHFRKTEMLSDLGMTRRVLDSILKQLIAQGFISDTIRSQKGLIVEIPSTFKPKWSEKGWDWSEIIMPTTAYKAASKKTKVAVVTLVMKEKYGY